MTKITGIICNIYTKILNKAFPNDIAQIFVNPGAAKPTLLTGYSFRDFNSWSECNLFIYKIICDKLL